jgi:hypothetical protein
LDAAAAAPLHVTGVVPLRMTGPAGLPRILFERRALLSAASQRLSSS